MKTLKFKGVWCSIIAAITYGTNPLGALNLYAEGINPDSVLFYRYGLSVVILAIIMLAKKTSFRLSKKELMVSSILGAIFAISSLSLFISFQHIDAGIASTILFIYPVMVSGIMTTFFKEKLTPVIIISTLLALSGIGLLYQPNGSQTMSSVGVFLVLVSALSYAIYIVVVNKSGINLSPIKLTFYVMLFGCLTILIHSVSNPNEHIQLLSTWSSWGWALMLAVFPTVISLVLMVIAVKEIGSTPTAIMGALEPVTAIIIGVSIFNEAFTPALAWGISLILLAVMLIISSESINRHINHWLKHSKVNNTKPKLGI
ncbi:MAG: DMT family transporter [Mangrovibacterium sp.]